MKTLHTVVALLGAALVLCVPAARADDQSGIRIQFQSTGLIVGSGKSVTDARTATGFQAVASRGSVKLVLRQGTREGVEISGDDNIVPLVETRVVERDGLPTLEIGMKRNSTLSPKLPLVATVDLVTLKAIAMSGGGALTSEALKTPSLRLALSGSADVRLRQLSVDELAANVSGSGKLDFGGKAGKLTVSLSGSGDVNTRALEADDVNVSIAGSGDVDVTARKTLNISIAGSGNVVYRGDAVVKTSIAGHGNVKKQ